jgi:hypothetical protein
VRVLKRLANSPALPTRCCEPPECVGEEQQPRIDLRRIGLVDSRVEKVELSLDASHDVTRSL